MAAISPGTASAAESVPGSVAPPDRMLKQELVGLDDQALLGLVRSMRRLARVLDRDPMILHGHVLNELQELVDNPDETHDLLRLGLHRLPIGQFPLLRGLAPVLAAYDGATELERGLDILLTGLATTVPPPAGARSSS